MMIGEFEDPHREIILIEPASSLRPAERREQWDVLLDHEGLSANTHVTRLTAFTPRQLTERPTTRPWRLLRSRTRPGQQLLPLIRVGPRLVAWTLVLVQVAGVGMLWRARRSFTQGSMALALTPQAALLSLLFARLAGVRLVVRLQVDLEALTATPVAGAVVRSVLRQADQVVAISQFTANVAKRAGVRDAAIRVLPPPIHPVFEGRPSFARETGSFRVGFLGRLEPEKGCGDALQAFARSRAEGWSLVIAGRGSESQRLRELAERLRVSGQIEWAGFLGREQVCEILETLHCVVVPTRIEEGFGRVAVEALLRGTPVVGYDSGGLREAGGPGALLVARGDVDALSQAISRLADEPRFRESLAIRGRKHALRYTLQTRKRLNEIIWED